ncbi:hypothetical protein B7R21_18985 [Subtercola boreus]|uniref:Uncharacterized protein n=1 Tax=Subtercola boreus TaxID=120213 RepID=A0A3E0VAN4_9MICO|nr:hypothetical protein B7R21_18985 [Subtercola boreus]
MTRIWQSKFFLEWGDSSMKQVRASFNSAMKKSAEEKFTVDVWTLVIPSILEPGQLKSFQTWATKQMKTHTVDITIWQGDELCSQLLSEEASHVRREFFPWTVNGSPLTEEEVAELEDDAEYDAALFVRQLREAGHVEVSAACGQYFATDALLRDLEARGSHSALAAFSSIRQSVHAAWEDRFNEAAPLADEHGQMKGLVRTVMADAVALSDPVGLRLAPSHKRGTAHHLVERGTAGWVTHWRNVAVTHASEKAVTETTVDEPVAPAPPETSVLTEPVEVALLATKEAIS